jgi:hypothetical protein
MNLKNISAGGSGPPSAIRIYSGFPRLIDCLYSKLNMEQLKMERAKHKSQNKVLFPRG